MSVAFIGLTCLLVGRPSQINKLIKQAFVLTFAWQSNRREKGKDETAKEKQTLQIHWDPTFDTFKQIIHFSFSGKGMNSIHFAEK